MARRGSGGAEAARLAQAGTTAAPAPARFFVGTAERLAPLAALVANAELDLPEGAAQHAKVRRLQPGDALRLFDGQGDEWPAQIVAIGRQAVRVRLGPAPLPPAAAELGWAVTLAFGVPANERADALIEKATELGAAALQPLVCERSVLRLAGERAERRRAHWQAVAAAACEQCGRATVPRVCEWRDLGAWLAEAGGPAAPAAARYLLSTDGAAPALARAWRAPAGGGAVVLLSGPEGGLAAGEERAARQAGFAPVSLGPRTLRADTAPLAALAWIALGAQGPARSRGA